tara:strand:- start:8034 stop:9902 length:1869 start_codon:yes stop_codon:yes gene_type:complete
MVNMNNELLPEIVSFLQTIPKFNALPSLTLKEIADSVDVIQLNAGQALNQDTETSYLYIIRSGIIKQNNPDGSLRSKLSNEDIFGFNLKLKQSGQTYSITAIEDTLLYRFNYALLVHKIEDYPNILSQLDLSLRTRLKASATEPNDSRQSLHQYMRPCSDVMSSKLVLASVNDTIQSVASKMRNIENISCAFIVDQDQALIGLVTDKDITQRVVAEALDVQQPIGSVMTATPYTIYGNELVMEAVQLMTKYNIQNIPVVDNKHHVVGYITPKDLIQNSGAQSVYLVNKIRHASSLDQLIALSHQRNAAFKEIMESTSSPSLVAQILTTIYDAFNYRLIELAIENYGTPPCAFSWIVAGSHARNEVHLASDQDNALILDDKATKSDRVYFNHLAMTVCKGLSELGYTLCKGRFMAATPKWCQTSRIWKEYFKLWGKNPEYESLLNLNVFVEIRHIYGNKSLFRTIDAYRHQQIIRNHPLTVALVRNALRTRPPLGIFQNLVLEKDGNNNRVLNIKKAAIACLVDVVRIYAIMNDCRDINTNDRIKWLYQAKILNKATYQDLIGTYQYVNHLRYQHQQQAIENNAVIDSLLKPNFFGSFERQHLKDSFRIVSTFQNLLKMKFIK